MLFKIKYKIRYDELGCSMHEFKIIEVVEYRKAQINKISQEVLRKYHNRQSIDIINIEEVVKKG